MEVTSPESLPCGLNLHSCWKEFDGLRSVGNLKCQCPKHRQKNGWQKGATLEPILRDRTLNPISRPVRLRLGCCEVLPFVLLREGYRPYHSSLCMAIASPQGEVAVWDRMKRLSYSFVPITTFHEVLRGKLSTVPIEFSGPDTQLLVICCAPQKSFAFPLDDPFAANLSSGHLLLC